MNRSNSTQLFEEAKSMFPGGVHSPVRAFKAVDGPPIFIEEAKGSRFIDADGNEFMDFCCSWGPLILGHAQESVVNAVQKQAEKGLSYGAPSHLGNELGKLITNNHQYIEKIRFVSSGTEAVMSAIRLARGYIGRNKIVKFEGCYHGHSDSLLVKAGSGLVTFGTSSSAGVPDSFVQETIVLPLDDGHALDQCFETHANDIAAVIIEPIPANNGLLLQDRSYLSHLKELCHKHEALLIFDEVISGFRVGFEGAAAYYNIQADLYTYGKIIGGGMPVGAYAGSSEIMSHIAPDGDVYQAGTLSANPMAMVAGYETLSTLIKTDAYTYIDDLCDHLVEKVKPVLEKKGFGIQAIGSIFWLKFSTDRISKADQINASANDHFRKLYSFLLDRGIYLGPSAYEVGFISTAHSKEDIDLLIEAIREYCNS